MWVKLKESLDFGVSYKNWLRQKLHGRSQHSKSTLTDQAAEENHNDQLVQSYGD